MTLALKDFEGDWQITRRIEDRQSGRIGHLQGRAVFAPDSDGLDYTESGLLEFPGQQPLTATQRYLWRSENNEIAVFFADGRAFHQFDPSQPHPQASHDCPPDWYDVRYEFTDWPNWRATWSVTGPRKDYVSVTEYHR